MENIIIDNSLFHEKAFQSELKTTKEPLLLFKKTLRKGYQSLIGRFTPGKNIELIVKQQTWLVDKLLIHAWQRFFKNDGLCLVAVGGYGRAELLLKSDIDLTISSFNFLSSFSILFKEGIFESQFLLIKANTL